MYSEREERHEAYGHGESSLSTSPNISEPTPPSGPKSWPGFPTATSAITRSSCASRKICCLPIANITAKTGQPMPRRWRPTRAPRNGGRSTIRCRGRSRLARRVNGGRWRKKCFITTEASARLAARACQPPAIYANAPRLQFALQSLALPTWIKKGGRNDWATSRCASTAGCWVPAIGVCGL